MDLFKILERNDFFILFLLRSFFFIFNSDLSIVEGLIKYNVLYIISSSLLNYKRTNFHKIDFKISSVKTTMLYVLYSVFILVGFRGLLSVFSNVSKRDELGKCVFDVPLLRSRVGSIKLCAFDDFLCISF